MIREELSAAFLYPYIPFCTHYKEAGCNLEAVMLWAGHSFDKDVKSSAVDRGYTDYSQEYLVQEAQKINYIL